MMCDMFQNVHVHICVCVCVCVCLCLCLCQLSNTSKCTLIAEWIKSITNCLYWCAASAPFGEGDDIRGGSGGPQQVWFGPDQFLTLLIAINLKTTYLP